MKLSKSAEVALRQEIAEQFRMAATRFASEQAAADDLGISRQRFRRYLEGKMTPKADVLLLAMARWKLRLSYQGVVFSAVPRRARTKVPVASQMKLDLFNEPQVVRSEGGNIRLRVARKELDTLRLSVEISLAS